MFEDFNYDQWDEDMSNQENEKQEFLDFFNKFSGEDMQFESMEEFDDAMEKSKQEMELRYGTPSAPLRSELEYASELSNLTIFQYLTFEANLLINFVSEGNKEVEFFGGYLDGCVGTIPKAEPLGVQGGKFIYVYDLDYQSNENRYHANLVDIRKM